MRTISVRLASIALVLCLAQAQEQQPAVPRFRTGVDIVLLDVTVLDRSRQPIRGLKATDFAILEEGRPQPIVSFDELSVPEPDGSLASWMRDVAPDVRTNTGDDRRIVLLVLDDATISFTRTQQVRKIGRAIIDRLGPADLTAIVYTGAQKRSQEFTSDHASLRAAVDQFVDTSMPLKLRSIYSQGTVRRAVEYLADIPHRRKALIFVSSVALDLGATTGPTALGGGTEKAAIARQASNEMQDMFYKAQRANVSVYPINPAGLEVSFEPGPDIATETLQTIANNTGGFAVVNTNSFDAQIRQIFRETGDYYLLGFQSAYTDGKFRRIDVRTNVPGATVRTRNGYVAPKPGKPEKPANADSVPAPLAKSVAGVLPNPDMPMRVSVAPFAVPGQKDGALAIVLGVSQPAPAGGERVRETVDLLAGAFTIRGEPAASRRQTAQLTLRPIEGGGEARYEVLTRLDVKSGRYNLRFGMHSTSLNTSGSVYKEIDVPDFSKQTLSLSGVVVSVAAGVLSAPKDVLTTLIPVVPTTQREFRRGIDDVSTFLRAYQGGGKPVAPVALRVRIVDASNSVVFERSDMLAVDQFGTSRAVDHRFTLPIERLEPGPHLLTFAAVAGKNSVTRDVRFVVR
jgi:VWFA-related protein